MSKSRKKSSKAKVKKNRTKNKKQTLSPLDKQLIRELSGQEGPEIMLKHMASLAKAMERDFNK
jgi:hypothetical protein